MPAMNMDVKLVQLIAYTDWHETEEKEKMENGSIMTMIGCLKRSHERNCKICRRRWSGWYMLIDEKTSTLGNLKYTDMVEDIQTTKMENHPYTIRKDALPKFVKILMKCMMPY